MPSIECLMHYPLGFLEMFESFNLYMNCSLRSTVYMYCSLRSTEVQPQNPTLSRPCSVLNTCHRSILTRHKDTTTKPDPNAKSKLFPNPKGTVPNPRSAAANPTSVFLNYSPNVQQQMIGQCQ